MEHKRVSRLVGRGAAPQEEYRVGPGRPPREYQWPKGHSGNGKGAKPKAPTLAPDLKNLLARALDKKITLQQGEKKRTLTLFAAGIDQFVKQYVKGDHRARKELFALAERVGLDLLGIQKKALEEALNIFRQLAQKTPETYLPKVAQALNNLAIIDRDQNRMDAAYRDLEEALKTFRELGQKTPDTYVSYVAQAVNNLAVLDQAQNRQQAAHKEYEEALKIFRELADKNPDTYLPYVAKALSNLAVLDQAQNRMEPARKELEEALTIYDRFAERNPERFQSDVTRVKDLLKTMR